MKGHGKESVFVIRMISKTIASIPWESQTSPRILTNLHSVVILSLK